MTVVSIQVSREAAALIEPNAYLWRPRRGNMVAVMLPSDKFDELGRKMLPGETFTDVVLRLAAAKN